MKNKITGIFLIVVISICSLNHVVYAKETPDELKNLYAQSAVLMDADSGRILFGKNEDKVLPMASTTKIMTCILALENMKKNQIAQVSEYAARQPKVHLGVRSGERYYVEDLLYSLMLESHNDSAVVIAEAIGGTVELFANMMNDKAEELGCMDTYFITPNGLDAEDELAIHSTTAEDLAMIMRYCIRNSPKSEEFLNITQTSMYQFTDIDKKRSFTCNNHNAFLGMMEGALSGKTGFTNDAGYCYVGALKRDERTFIVVLLACGWPNNRNYKWKDTIKLMEYGLENYTYRNIYKKWENAEIDVENGAGKEKIEVGVMPHSEEILVLAKNEEKIHIEIILQDTVIAPVKVNQKIGQIIYSLDDKILKIENIVALENVIKRDYKWCLSEVVNDYLFRKKIG